MYNTPIAREYTKEQIQLMVPGVKDILL